MTRLAAKKDANHNDIVRTLEAVGLHVTDLSQVGNGVPDVLVTGYNRKADRVVALLVEIKNANGKLTEREKEYFARYPEDGPLIVAREASDVLRWFGVTQ